MATKYTTMGANGFNHLRPSLGTQLTIQACKRGPSIIVEPKELRFGTKGSKCYFYGTKVLVKSIFTLLNQDTNHIFVLTFSVDSHFDLQISFLPFLVPILKNASHFGLCHYIKDEKCTRGKRKN